MKGRAVAQALSSRRLLEKDPIRFRILPCVICGRQIGHRTGFYLTISVFPFSVIPPILHSLYIHAAPNIRTNERGLRNFQKEYYFGNWRTCGR